METPVLTQSQKSKSLSGNKSKQKKKTTKIRNVLASFSSDSSIKLSDEDSIIFEEKLSEIFHYVPPKKPAWDELKNIPKEKRSEFRKRKEKHHLMVNFIFGINEVTRSIEKQSCLFVLISNDINPGILTRHIHEGCTNNKIPLFVVQDLKNICRKCFGFPTITMAFKNIPDELLIIKEFFISFAPELTQIINNNKVINDELIRKKHKQQSTDVKQNTSNASNKRKFNGSDVYLFRVNTKNRCFIPPSSVSNPENVEKNQSMDFIELGSSDSHSHSDSEPDEVNNQFYKNLKVKRVKPNLNRLKGKKKF